MNIILASDRNFFHGLTVTVSSILFHEKQQALIIHILDGGLTDSQWRILAAMVERISTSTKLIRHNFDQAKVNSFCQHGELGHMTYARIFIPFIVDAPRAIYIDADFLVTKPISNLLPVFESDDALSGVMEFETISEDCPWGEGMDLSQYRYVNGGILVMNLERWRKDRIAETLIDFLKKESAKCRFADQTAFNWLLRGKIGILPSEWNVFANSVDRGTSRFEPGTINIHYASGMKPWKRPLPTLSHKLWWMFTRRFARLSSQPKPFLHLDNIFRYIRYKFKSVNQAGCLNDWESFWNEFNKIS